MASLIKDKPNNKTVRNSGVELLRIFAMFSIIICHVYASDKNITGYNGYIMVVINSLLNAGTGVVIFMLISGYFSIKLSFERFNSVYGTIICCVIASFVLKTIILHDSSIKVSYFIPVLSFWQWYISCYVFTMLLSPFLNRFCEKIEKKDYQKLLAVLIVLFYILPTFFYFTITNDEGKGFVYMIIAYLIGRYLRLYPINIKKKYLIIALAALLTINTVGNLSTAVIIGKMKWLFSRDLTIITLLTAIVMLLIALKADFKSKLINAISSKNLFVYLLMINNYIVAIFDITKYYKSPLLLPICFAVAVSSYAVSVVLAFPLSYVSLLISKVMLFIENIAMKAYSKIKPKLITLYSKVSDTVLE